MSTLLPGPGLAGPWQSARVTPRELEVFWLVGDRLPNREIADRLRLSERTVESHVSALLRKLGGANRLALVEAAERLRAHRELGGVLPKPLSSFVGRGREAADVGELVSAHRLVTLTGPAGIGKTRLALHLAHTLTTLPPPVLVDLAAVRPGDPVDRAFADALGIFGDGRRLRLLIRQALATGQRWLVVDNCEHVADAAADLLAGLLATTGDLHVLATSHGPLRVAGEVTYAVPTLRLPGESDDPDDLLGTDSGRLFADRAAAVLGNFAVTPGNARQIAAICRQLDGLPLAIELAAARIPYFAPAELLARLSDRFAFLAGGAHGHPGRHRTLEEALRWSYELLDPGERLLFQRCSVFPAEFGYDTAAAVLTYPPLDPADLARLFPRLLDRALITTRPGQPTQYRLLDSIRQFAHRELAACGGDGLAREQHARHFLRYAVDRVPELRGPDQAAGLRWFARHWADLRAAMRWALEQPDTAPAWEFITGIGTRWAIIGTRGELFDWAHELLTRPLPDGALGTSAAVTCALLYLFQDNDRATAFARQACERGGTEPGRGMTLLALGATTRVEDSLWQAAEWFEQAGDHWHHALAVSILGRIAADTGTALARLTHAASLFGRLHDHVTHASCLTLMAIRAVDGRTRLDEVQGWVTEAARLARLSGSRHELLNAQTAQACLDQCRGDHAAARAKFAEILGEVRRIGDGRVIGRCLRGLGRAAVIAGDHEQARRVFTEAIQISGVLGDHRAAAMGLLLLAGAEDAAGQSGAASSLRHAAGLIYPQRPGTRVPVRELREVLRACLGPGALEGTGELMPRQRSPGLAGDEDKLETGPVGGIADLVDGQASRGQ